MSREHQTSRVIGLQKIEVKERMGEDRRSEEGRREKRRGEEYQSVLSTYAGPPTSPYLHVHVSELNKAATMACEIVIRCWEDDSDEGCYLCWCCAAK